jgi:cobalt-zinc-cadmium efflux system protein
VISFFIFYEAFRRVQNPQPVHAPDDVVAGAGVVMNGVIALLLYRSGGDINIRSALLHEVGDTLPPRPSSRAAGPSWSRTNTDRFRALLRIGALILWSSVGILRETMNILLEGTPRGMKLDRLEAAIRKVEGVNDVHDLHVWSIGSERPRALLPHRHRRHPAVRQRAHPARRRKSFTTSG